MKKCQTGGGSEGSLAKDHIFSGFSFVHPSLTYLNQFIFRELKNMVKHEIVFLDPNSYAQCCAHTTVTISILRASQLPIQVFPLAGAVNQAPITHSFTSRLEPVQSSISRAYSSQTTVQSSEKHQQSIHCSSQVPQPTCSWK